MLSESARMSSAAEARFRILTPGSTGRVVKVISLDTATAREVAMLVEAVPAADLVVMVASAGTNPDAVALIGEACSLARVMTTALVVGAAAATEEALSRTLARVRPWSLMVLVVGDAGGLDDLLTSFR